MHVSILNTHTKQKFKSNKKIIYVYIQVRPKT